MIGAHKGSLKKLLAGILPLAVCLQGNFVSPCASAQLIQLYDPGRDLAAQQIKSNFARIDVTSVIRIQATNLDAIAAVELGEFKAFAAMQRDFELFEIVNAANLNEAFFGEKVDGRLDELLGNSDWTTVKLNVYHADQRTLEQEALSFKTSYGVAPPPFNNSMAGFPSEQDWFSGATVFVPADVADLTSLAHKLAAPSKGDLLSPEVKRQLSPETANVLGQYVGGADARLQGALADDLNRMVGANRLLCDTNLFVGVKLSAETITALTESPIKNFRRLNILLLLDAYPEISKGRFETHSGGDVPGGFSRYRNACAALVGDFAQVQKTDGELAAALQAWLDSQAQLAADQAAASRIAGEYKSALAAYNAAATNGTPADATGEVAQFLAKIKNAASTADTKAQALAAKGGILGRLVVITNELADVDAVISTMASTNSAASGAAITDPKLKRAAAVAAVLPGVLDKSISLAKAIRQPLLLGLLIDRDILAVKKDMAERAIDRQKQRILLRQRYFESLLAEASLLNEIQSTWSSIQKEFDAASIENAKLAKPLKLENPLEMATLDAMLPAVRDSWRFQLESAFLKYAETVRVYQYQANVAQLGLTHVTFQEANDASQGAALMWNSLIAGPVNQLAQYHAGGVKPETIADILSKFFIGGALLGK